MNCCSFVIKSLIKICGVLFLALIIITVLSNIFVIWGAHGKVYDVVDDVPYHKAALVLGTSKYVVSGKENLYYRYRIDAAHALYEAGIVDALIVSGDNATLQYDEPTQMQKDLIARGVPEEDIYLDYAGFRTLDSVVRAKEVFGQQSFIIVSQEFHNNRALLIAQMRGIDAVGYNAQNPYPIYVSRAGIREVFARTKLVYDLIIGKQPKFLGDPVIVE